MNELTKQHINDECIKKRNKKSMQRVISKIWASEQTFQEMDSGKAIYETCITTLIIFVPCTGKFSPSTKSSYLKKVFCLSMLEPYFTKFAKFHRGCFPVYFQENFRTLFL